MTRLDASSHDATLRAAIAAAANPLHFNNRPGSVARQCALGLFVAALSDRLALEFPESADALRALVFSPATPANPAVNAPQQPEQQQ
ncbi:MULTISPECIES: hypothetical protein [Burkholderia]|uniref:hypothetical protein n=1 Tax=Burkholderia TaxID=32008 RepID=UPI00080BC2EB|nr:MULTISPECIES: hypothetical protein [Burkholderia]MBU9224033.1 hypothetical protein [Burkholderia multivorans]MDN7475109.1 hypothetical protein [Burkholderia multivorans]MDN7844296.1 hypothetical protein [Burkholderia multivorans]MDR8877047.1 hypothetical protein [Burkholderia multivorans]MDR8880251.1 hypothetical protein [Burkholderia multivorans]